MYEEHTGVLSSILGFFPAYQDSAQRTGVLPSVPEFPPDYWGAFQHIEAQFSIVGYHLMRWGAVFIFSLLCVCSLLALVFFSSGIWSLVMFVFIQTLLGLKL